MASSTATMNKWIEQLAASLSEHRTTKTSRKDLEIFARTVKQQKYSRPYAVAVHDKIVSLQEACYILNREDVATALRERHSELSQHRQLWVPDVLDLLLRLSDNPTTKSRIEDLVHINHRSSNPLPLSWADVNDNDPTDQHDPIWQVPRYSDLSSDEDEVLASSSASSPVSIKHGRTSPAPNGTRQATATIALNPKLILNFQDEFVYSTELTGAKITEVQLTRELLFLVQGLQTSIFIQSNNDPVLDPRYSLATTSHNTIRSLLRHLLPVTRCMANIVAFLNNRQQETYLQVMQDKIRSIQRRFQDLILRTEKEIQFAIQKGGTVSLLRVCEMLQRSVTPLLVIESFLCKTQGKESVAYLDILYEHCCELSSFGDKCSHDLLDIFCATFERYAVPIDQWIRTGRINDDQASFFVQRVKDEHNKATLWRSWYIPVDTGSQRCPKFLHNHVNAIFTAGKTGAFLRELNESDLGPSESDRDIQHSFAHAVISAASTSKSSLSSFAAAFEEQIQEYVYSQLKLSTSRLQAAMQKTCRFDGVLEVFEYLYLSKDKSVLDMIETRLFERINRSLLTWHDRFLVVDLFQDAYATIDSIEVQRLILRTDAFETGPPVWDSVKIMDAIDVEYILPWPAANIILPQSLHIYCGVSRLLRQIRRAKYELERVHPSISSTRENREAVNRKPIQALYFRLLFMVNTIYDHFLGSVVHPLTNKMRRDLKGTLDDMIQVHDSYIHDLEYGCILSKNLKTLNETLIYILDICIEFSVKESRAKDLGDLAARFARQATFLIAGLRAMAANGGEAGERTELLADRLAGLRLQPGRNTVEPI